ncbi:MAG: hypothetical protein KJ607_12695, partial [Bacteroidetes bacterium]|nr:hypothetical protein [Bacteroidota bacterium]
RSGEMANQYKNKAPMFGIYFPNSLSVMYDSKNPSEVNKYHKSKVLTQKNIQYHRIINFANNDVLIYLKKNEPVKLLSFEK